jgi:hypothetical protein
MIDHLKHTKSLNLLEFKDAKFKFDDENAMESFIN